MITTSLQVQAVYKMAVNKKGITLLEIIIATVIMATIMTGLASAFIGGKKLIQHLRLRMGSGEIGRKFLDPLQAYVRQDTWDSSCFGTSKDIAYCPNVPTTSSPYAAAYSISDLAADANIKKVKVTISWGE